MEDVVDLDEHRPMKPLYSLLVYKRANGSLFAQVDWANPDWVDANGDSVSERFEIIASDLPKMAASLHECALEFADRPTEQDE